MHWKLAKAISKDKKRPVIPDVTPRLFSSVIPPPPDYYRAMPPGRIGTIDPASFHYPMLPLMSQAMPVMPTSMLPLAMSAPAIPAPLPMPMPTPLPFQRPPERPISRASSSFGELRRRNSLPDIRTPEFAGQYATSYLPSMPASPSAAAAPATLPAFRGEEVKEDRPLGLPSIAPLLRGVERLQMEEENAKAAEGQASMHLSQLIDLPESRISTPGMPSSSTPLANDSAPSQPPSVLGSDRPTVSSQAASSGAQLLPPPSDDRVTPFSLHHSSSDSAISCSVPSPSIPLVSKMSIASLLE